MSADPRTESQRRTFLANVRFRREQLEIEVEKLAGDLSLNRRSDLWWRKLRRLDEVITEQIRLERMEFDPRREYRTALNPVPVCQKVSEAENLAPLECRLEPYNGR